MGEREDVSSQGMPPGAAQPEADADVVDVPSPEGESDQAEADLEKDPNLEDVEAEGDETQKEKPLPPEFETGFSEAHKHLEFLFKHLSDFFLFTPSGRVDTTARAEMKAYIEEIKDTHPCIAQLAKKLMSTADQLSMAVEKEGVPVAVIEAQGAALAEGLYSRFDIILAAAQDISGEEISGALGVEGLKQTKQTLYKVVLSCLQFVDARQMAFVTETIQGQPEEEEPIDLYDDADDTLDAARQQDDEQDNDGYIRNTQQKKPVMQDPVLVGANEEGEEETEDDEGEKGLDYSYGFIEPLNVTVDFVTRDERLAEDWRLMRDVGFVTGQVYMDDPKGVRLRAYERVLPWVGPLRMDRFFSFNIRHRSKNRDAFKRVESLQGGYFPEAIFLDTSEVAINAYKGGKNAWDAYTKTPHYLGLIEQFGLEE